jgi:hypothetical protein
VRQSAASFRERVTRTGAPGAWVLNALARAVIGRSRGVDRAWQGAARRSLREDSFIMTMITTNNIN